jgi:hypothetical protein
MMYAMVRNVVRPAGHSVRPAIPSILTLWEVVGRLSYFSIHNIEYGRERWYAIRLTRPTMAGSVGAFTEGI